MSCSKNNKILISALVVVVWTIFMGCDNPTGPPYNKSRRNHPPELSGLKDTTAVVGTKLIMRFDAHDPDGDALIFGIRVVLTSDESAEGYIPKAGINREELYFWYTPATRDGTERFFGVLADDQRGETTLVMFRVDILR
jgi:hypothetical protein